MAFKDLVKVLYDGQIRISYLDKPHMYFKQDRIDFELPEDDEKAWGKKTRPKGTTTLLADTLEKKGLMTWPMGLALRELFGFYDFTNEHGKKMTGFSKGVGTLRAVDGGLTRKVKNDDDLMEHVLSASKAWQRKQKQGADIGSIVHDAIEHYVLANTNRLYVKFDENHKPVLNEKGETVYETQNIGRSNFDIGESYIWNIKEAFPIPAIGEPDEFEEQRNEALKRSPEEIAMAVLAFEQFTTWWDSTKPELIGAEDLIYSREFNVSGTFDGLLRIGDKIVMADWKTSNASASKDAAAAQGVYYSYFIQSAIYAMAWAEMGLEKVDDLLIVSCRKDGGFDHIYASDLGLTVDDCIAWAKSAISCYQFMDKSKRALNKLAEAKEKK